MATATASEIQRYQSLIPYLQGKGEEPRLKLDLFPWGARQRELTYPFALIDDSHPVSRLLEARFVTDGGFILKKVLLQVQKDRYSLTPGFDSAANGEIDASWRNASSGEGKAGDGGAAVPLQLDGDGVLVPLAPLFYCREKERFFPPLCPACGLPLTLCTDEPLLERFGLAPYRGSLKRYLHCGSCSRHGLPEFYRFETEPDDPVTVKDRWTLMERFRQIDSCMDPDGELPCVGCAERDACFGAEHEARRRIVPFSFYPFHLLVTELPTLYGSDFLHLLSGAEPGELAARLDPQRAPGRVALLKELVASGRVRGTLYSPEDDRFFPEALFLKLTLLGDVLRLLDPAASSFGLDRVVVRLPQGSGELPAFWNYDAGLLPEVAPASCSRGSLSVPSANLARFALCYIQLLCSNSEDGVQGIHAALSRWLGEENAGAEPAQEGVAEILRAENLFWQPARQVVGEKWLPFWERACAPPLKLLGAARDGAPAPSVNAILEELGELRGELKRALLSAGDPYAEAVRGAAAAPEPPGFVQAAAAQEPPPVVPSPGGGGLGRGGNVSWPSESVREDSPSFAQPNAAPPLAAVDVRAVRAVLEKLKEQARCELREEPSAPLVPPTPTQPPREAASVVPPQSRFDDDETMETVILSPGPLRPRGTPFLPPVDVCETRLPGRPLQAQPESPREELLETMVAPGSRLQAPPTPFGEGAANQTTSYTSSPCPPSPPGERVGVRRDDAETAPVTPRISSPYPSSRLGERAEVRVDGLRGSEPDELTETIFVRPPGGGRPGGRST